MKKIVCELCEGTVFDKVDGRFVCKGCGTSYSVEEAKGMMQEVEGDAPVPNGVPVTPVSVPQGNSNQQQLDNILLLASSAYEADNKSEAENYCNQAIVIDAMCYKAWLLKGKAVGWSSTMDNIRFEEAAHSFVKAIEFAPEDQKEEIKEEAVEELKNLGLAVLRTRKSRFAQYYDDKELAGFMHDRVALFDALLVLKKSGNDVGIPDGFLEEVATLMYEAGIEALGNLREKWKSFTFPEYETLKQYLHHLDNIESLIREAIKASDDDDEKDITRYESLIIVIEEPMYSCSYKKVWNSYANRYIPTRDYYLTDSAKESRRNRVQQCKERIASIERKIQAKKDAARKKAEEEKKARLEAYWSAHAEEKAALEAELAELEEKSTALGKEISEIDSQMKEMDPKGKVPFEEERDKLNDQVRDLCNKRANLGVFAGKEKKQINEEIAMLEGRMDALKSKIKEEKQAKKAKADQKMGPLMAKKSELSSQKEATDKRIAAINKELTKDPEE